MATSGSSIPDRMLRLGRAPDPVFDGDERMFRRFPAEQIAPDGKLAASAIGYESWSVNRSKYSEPEDVLLPSWANWGIAMFLVEHLPDAIKTEQGTNVFEFKPEHKPEEENYSHSEIVTFKNGVPAQNPKPPAEVKKKYRQILRDRMEIIKPAAG